MFQQAGSPDPRPWPTEGRSTEIGVHAKALAETAGDWALPAEVPAPAVVADALPAERAHTGEVKSPRDDGGTLTCGKAEPHPLTTCPSCR